MSTPTIERHTNLGDVEFRAEGNKLVARGYGAVFNRYSQNLGGFVEQFAPGAFSKTIGEQDIRGLFNHDANMVLGRSVPGASGTMRLLEDKVGLAYEIDLPDTSTGRDVAKLLERGDVSGSSIGFRAVEEEWGLTPQDFPLRTVTQAGLRDVGPVTFPAYTDTEAALRHLAEQRSLDLDVLVSAAKAGTLTTLIFDPEPGDETNRNDPPDPGRETRTQVRSPIAHLF